MKSNKENNVELFEGVKKKLVLALSKLRSVKISLPRLSAFRFNQPKGKSKILREKYTHSRSRTKPRHNTGKKSAAQENRNLSQYFHIPEFTKSWLQSIKKLKLPKVSLNLTSLLKSVKEMPRRLRLPAAYQSCRRLVLELPRRLRLPAAYQSCSRLIVKLLPKRLLPKFSLSQLFVPGNRPKHLNIKTVAAALVALSIGGFMMQANSRVDAYAVEIDGKQIAFIKEKAEAEKLLLDLKAEKARIWNRRVDVTQKLAFKSAKAKKFEIKNLIAMKSILNKNLKFEAVAIGIKVDGKIAVVVKDAQVAENVLQQIKDAYKPEDLKVSSVTFQEKIELADVPVSLGDVLPVGKAVQLLEEGKQKKVVHVVKEGDSLWSIARAYDMHMVDLLKANPSIKGEHLDLKQEINLVALEPVVTVVISGERTAKENLAYKVVVNTDRNQWRGRESVKVQGKNGQREVTYKLVMKNGTIASKDVVQEKILIKPVDKVVVRGSKLVVASRSGGGQVGWPIVGRITSAYGRRHGGRHTGLDIDGYKGQPVGAAAAGKVITAGWGGGYGKMVVIRHNNGLVTRYAHLSKIEVSVGRSVDRGDLIGLVGSTGHSTGSHLHFEVISGGSFQNPTKYLK